MSEDLISCSGGSRVRNYVDVRPIPRCCARHVSWAQLAQHLLDEFPDATIGSVVRELRRAKDAVEHVELTGLEDGLQIGELIVRHQLLLLTGRVDDAARLDPEQHARGILTP